MGQNISTKTSSEKYNISDHIEKTKSKNTSTNNHSVREVKSFEKFFISELSQAKKGNERFNGDLTPPNYFHSPALIKQTTGNLKKSGTDSQLTSLLIN